MDSYNINSKNVKSTEKINNYPIITYENDNEELDEKIYESSKGEKNRSINFVNKCFDFNNNDDSNEIADEYVIKIIIFYINFLVDL